MKQLTSNQVWLGAGLLFIGSLSYVLLYQFLPQMAEKPLPPGVFSVASPTAPKPEFHLIRNGLLGVAHLIFGTGTLLGGFALLLLPKGTTLHKNLGRFFAFSLIFTDFSALNINNTGHLHAFHLLAVVSLAMLFLGILPVVFSKSAWAMEMHLRFLYWSIPAPLAAFCAEMLARYPGTAYYAHLPVATVHSVIFWLVLGYIGQVIYLDSWTKRYAEPRRKQIARSSAINQQKKVLRNDKAA